MRSIVKSLKFFQSNPLFCTFFILCPIKFNKFLHIEYCIRESTLIK